MACNTFCHIEWEVTDLERAQRFYEGLFGWRFSSFEGHDMVVFGTGEQHLGGLSRVEKVTPGTSPSVWLEVEDIDAYAAKAPALGGSVVRAKSDLPGVGFSGVLGDPDGNHVGIVQFVRK